MAFSEYYPAPGRALSDRVMSQIKACDYFLALLTPEGGRSASVHQEIGAAKALNKRIIPVVERGAELRVMLQGIEYMELDIHNPTETMNRIANWLKRIKEEIERNQTAFVLLLLLALFGLGVAAAARR